MGRAELIGPGKHHLIPAWQPAGTGNAPEGKRKVATKPFRTQHTGLKGVTAPKNGSRAKARPAKK
jgi:hypothetical protein